MAAEPTAEQTFALWQTTGYGKGALIASATVTSAALTAGQWNYAPLTTPVQLALGVTYVACTGLNNSFPITGGQFGAGGPFSGGITNGPLTAFSDTSGSKADPFSNPQCCFSTLSNDPTASPPAQGYLSSNLWIDLQVLHCFAKSLPVELSQSMQCR